MKKRFILLALTALLPVSLNADEIPDTLEQSVITGTRTPVLRDVLPVPVSVIGRETIADSDENVLMPTLMEQVPGLFVTSRGVTGYGVSNGAAGGISLRGFSASSGRVLVLIDGHPQYEAIYGHPVADEYVSESAERVEVSRGAASVLYGSNAMGGAINIITRKPHADGNKLTVNVLGGSYGTARASITDTYSKGKFYIIGTASHDRTDGHRANSAFHSTSGMLKAGYRFSDNWDIVGNANVVGAYSENPGSVSTPILDGTANVTRVISGLSLNNSYGKTYGAVNLYFNYGNHVINDGHTESAQPQEYLFHGTDWQGGMNAYQSVDLRCGNTLSAGLDFKLYGGNAYRNPTTEIYADHLKLNETAAYVFDKQTLGKFMLNAGLRLERHNLYGFILVPQAGVSYRPEPNTTLKLSASRGFRTPNLRELYMYAVANESLIPEDAWSYDFTAGHHFLDGRLDTEISLFYTTGSNIIEVTVEDGVRRNRNAGEFANAGVELSASWLAAKGLKFNTNYSYLHMDKILTGAPEHKLYLGGSWTKGRFGVNLGAMGIAGLYLSTGDNAKTSSYIDLKAKVSCKIFKFATVFVRGDNLLNRSYQTMLGFPEPGITVLGGLSIEI